MEAPHREDSSTDDGSSPGRSPGAVYAERSSRHGTDLARHRSREQLLSNLRLLTFGLGLALGWFVFGSRSLEAVWLAPPVAAFLALLILHDRAIQARKRAERAVAFYEAGIARLEDRWMGLGETGIDFLDPHHPYANDLDLFGEGSLFELLCTARTAAGQATIARWLETQAGAGEVRARQAAVAELTPHLDLREELAMLGQEVRSHLHPDALVRWGEAPVTFAATRGLHLAGFLVSLASVSALVAWPLLGIGPIPFLILLALQLGFAASLRNRIKPILESLDGPTRDLRLLRDLLKRLESESMTSPRLVELLAKLDTDGLPPSQNIARLQRLVDLLDARRNQLFAPIAGLLLWGTQLGLAAESWRARCGSSLAGWLEAVGEIEALAAFSGYAYENPDDIFPEIIEGDPLVEGRSLGHPLLPRTECVRNDLSLGGDQRALIVSGSNMSGKSTFLRTAGCNILLALAGAPVRARSMRLSPLAIAASIQIQDSLMQGTSHFYAEIKRLRQVVSLCDGNTPVFFLLDEILHGTNSHDRRIGASAVVKGLVERGALGLVTTHDLALARIADELTPAIMNVHFQDHLEDGRMAFDYAVRPGVVEKSNALELMRAVGLEV